jgi:4-hydroxy-tetrahydrodipicolinate reductase
MSDSEHILVLVAGAAGRMGKEVIRAVWEAPDMEIVGAVDVHGVGEDAGKLAGIGDIGVPILSDIQSAIAARRPDVCVDFTVAGAAEHGIDLCARSSIPCVSGATGLARPALEAAGAQAEANGVGILVAPNFAIGAVLMMRFAAEAARYMPDAEIIELHHENKLDAPSGTALLTADRIAQSRRVAGAAPRPAPAGEIEKVPGARGARGERTGGVPIHSVRLPGFVAHQEVILGGVGQILTIRHDSTDRRSFMPGVLLAIRRVRELKGLVFGLESVM